MRSHFGDRLRIHFPMRLLRFRPRDGACLLLSAVLGRMQPCYQAEHQMLLQRLLQTELNYQMLLHRGLRTELNYQMLLQRLLQTELNYQMLLHRGLRTELNYQMLLHRKL